MILIILAAISVLGGLATIAYSDPIDKLIMLAITSGGIVGFIAQAGYLDVASLVAVMLPISTVIVVTVLIRRAEVVK